MLPINVKMAADVVVSVCEVCWVEANNKCTAHESSAAQKCFVQKCAHNLTQNSLFSPKCATKFDTCPVILYYTISGPGESHLIMVVVYNWKYVGLTVDKSLSKLSVTCVHS